MDLILGKLPDSKNSFSWKNRLKKCSEKYLKGFFTYKTHKEKPSLRVIVDEGETFQYIAASFLLQGLKILDSGDPYEVKNTEELVEILNEYHGSKVYLARSYDVENMYFNMNHKVLMTAVSERIVNYGVLEFRNKSNMEIDDFLKFLELYLSSTILKMEDICYRQKSGVCIGCKAAPFLSSIYLGRVNRALQIEIESRGLKEYIRNVKFVDDYLTLHRKDVDVSWIKEFLEIASVSMNFTVELMENDSIQFLDIKIYRCDKDGMCWEYKQRSEKELLSYTSSHERSVKAGIITTCLRSAALKSCCHFAERSLKNQVRRLLDAKYPIAVIKLRARKLVKRLIQGNGLTQRKKERDRKVATAEFFHGISSRVAKSIKKYDIDLVSKYPKKLRSIVTSLGREKKDCQKAESTHTEFVECGQGMVYSIPLSCGNNYIGQSGRCINQRLTEHQRDINGSAKVEGKLLKAHVEECGCNIQFQNTKNLRWNNDWISREIEEAYQIQIPSNRAISDPSIKLTKMELLVLKQERNRDFE
jgi:hypothetical protein